MSLYEPPHDKTNKMACAPSEYSDQPGHPPSLIRVFAVRMKKHWALNYLWAHSEDSDKTGRMPRLIWVLDGRTCQFVGFVMRRLVSRYFCTSGKPEQSYSSCCFSFLERMAKYMLLRSTNFCSLVLHHCSHAASSSLHEIFWSACGH